MLLLITRTLASIRLCKKSKIQAILIRILCKSFFQFLNLKIEVNQTGIVFPKRFILISNHVSFLDGLILFSYIPDISIVSDIEHELIPIFGKLIKCIKTFKLDRRSISEKISSFEKLIIHVDQGNNILIFSQGETLIDINNFNIGAFIIAKKTCLPIIPVYIEFASINDFCFTPPWNFFESYKKIVKSKNKNIKIRIFSPIIPDEFNSEKDLAETLLMKYKKWNEIFQPNRSGELKPIESV